MTDRATHQERREELAAYILAHPERFAMEVFGARSACGTTTCIAGTAALLAQDRGLCTVEWCQVNDDDEDDREHMRLSVFSGSERRDIDYWAKDYLGLTNRNMFYNMDLWKPELAAEAILNAPYVQDEVES